MKTRLEEETITITKKEYLELYNIREKFYALQGAGVNNWEGYDIAMETCEEITEVE
ncbi:hypothetical protein KQI42_19955 [Tissierella sp. MSJ-40]|uniref:Phage protein n=1 Tax=Tissierella simiarum TaxID=2841534 RepID=A0ABS6EBG4_9FIRM|nr:hypothetical protein [Tissierella simiarum]MBU5440272.1 hypothetical protein [Tissierella simiarum]